MLGNNLLIGGKPLGYILNIWFALNPIGENFNFQIWQLVTYQFMHGGFGHIFFNMFILWMFGMEIENIWGSKKFLYFYLICGVTAGLAQLFIAPLFSVPAPTIGASGAVFGVMIAFALSFPDRYIYLWFLIPIKAKYLIGFLFVLEIFWIGDAGSNVAHLAHLGGALAGFIFIMLDKRIDVPLKRMINSSPSSGSGGQFENPFAGLSEKLRKRKESIQDANYYDLNNKNNEEQITQEQIDNILDKISQSGYQNLTEKEKKILFEASKKMN
ncbi:MAG: rhomboid family intramembrane serine protease [Ignavibacteria bacterium]|nr:rhomboid family intramembrane serine protease [Ignavibacteria bacterium]MBT8381417.1 rhomboid family intramembrane serine protease [Ignavibacteria bacterium]MBT8390154.1 rhomboid family intramembrane serine protease [Ignavibacteria bacterium]NNJ53239.1 rhomboid family intramembrane serine protease [Ignavibacteriaceae bacterium]NNL20333.1 rhomboid family intramembrane serine protease [Ignavibacteriaceae bacterium]